MKFSRVVILQVDDGTWNVSSYERTGPRARWILKETMTFETWAESVTWVRGMML